jgi:hypothetical protein
MDIASLLEVGAAAVALGTLVFSAGRFTESVRANTNAIEKLSEVIDGHLTWSAEIVREHDERFHDHDTRISEHDSRISRLEEDRRRR